MCNERAIFKFLGGPGDGRTFDSNSPDQLESNIADMMFGRSEDGTIGRVIRYPTLADADRVSADRPFDPNSLNGYRIVDRVETDAAVAVSLVFVGRGADGGLCMNLQ